jgi:hypothetical protein
LQYHVGQQALVMRLMHPFWRTVPPRHALNAVTEYVSSQPQSHGNFSWRPLRVDGIG